MTVRATCHCGAIALSFNTAPTEVTDCNCSICRRYGVLWAYYSPHDVTMSPSEPVIDTYLWNGRHVAFNRCATCGCVTHWSATDKTRDRMGVNARLLPVEVLAQARVRHLDGAGSEEYID